MTDWFLTVLVMDRLDCCPGKRRRVIGTLGMNLGLPARDDRYGIV